MKENKARSEKAPELTEGQITTLILSFGVMCSLLTWAVVGS